MAQLGATDERNLRPLLGTEQKLLGMRHGLAERVIPEGHQMLRFTVGRFQVTGVAGAQYPDVPRGRKVEDPEGPLLLLIGGPDRHNGQGSAGGRIDPLGTGQRLLMRLGVQEGGSAGAPSLFEALVERRDQG